MKQYHSRPKSLAERIAWLFSKDGLPVLVSIIAGVVIGFVVNGAVGLVLATIAGFGIMFLFNKLPIRLTPWQALVIDVGPVLAKLSFFMIFLLPVASYLTLPSGHTPDTLTKYLSIVIALPDNLVSKPGTDVFPGFAIVVIISMILMLWGSSNLGKTRNLLLALGGLLLYTFSPTIASILTGDVRLRIIMSFFSIGYYLAWVGLLLIIVSKVLPQFLKVNPSRMGTSFGLPSILPPVIAFGVFNQFSGVDLSGHIPFIGAFDFEETHHLVAGVFSGGIAGWGAGVITSGNEAPPEEDEPEEPPVPQGPVPSTDPDDPPGTTIQNNPDGTSTKRRPDGFVGTKYSDGTVYVQGPNGETGVYYPDGITKEWTPEAGLEVTHPNGDMEWTSAEGAESSVTNNKDGSIDIKSGYGGNLHIPKEGNPEGTITTWDGNNLKFNGDGSASMTTAGGTMTVDKDGNLSGSMSDGKGNRITIGEDGSVDAENADGDKLKIDADGLKAKFKDGSFVNMDAKGNLTSAHVTGDDGVTYDASTDDKGGLHLKDNQGNSADINKDGSGQMKGADGFTATQDSQGNATFTSEGTTWAAKKDGSGTISDKKGNRIDLGKDGSLTVKDAQGKTTTYTADQVGQMQAQANGSSQGGGAVNSSTGGS